MEKRKLRKWDWDCDDDTTEGAEARDEVLPFSAWACRLRSRRDNQNRTPPPSSANRGGPGGKGGGGGTGGGGGEKRRWLEEGTSQRRRRWQGQSKVQSAKSRHGHTQRPRNGGRIVQWCRRIARESWNEFCFFWFGDRREWKNSFIVKALICETPLLERWGWRSWDDNRSSGTSSGRRWGVQRSSMWKMSATRVELTPLFLGTVRTPIPRTDTTTTRRKTPIRTPVIWPLLLGPSSKSRFHPQGIPGASR